MPIFNLLNARLVGHADLQRLRIQDGWITAIDRQGSPLEPEPPADQVLDMAGDWVSLGGIDVQINGALGLAFPDLVPGMEEKLAGICQFLWEQGIDGFLPTLVTTATEKFHQALAVIQAVQQQAPAGAEILGAHLEGPCLNPAKRGAHPAEFLRPLTVAELEKVFGDYGEVVRVVTLAPELDPTGEAIAWLRWRSLCHAESHPWPPTHPPITVSLGHSTATADQARQAFTQGATMVTHAFNAMPGLHHREPGLLGAALTTPGVSCGLIADGQHVCPTMLDLLLRACRREGGGYQGLFLVSDALAPLGLPDGVYPWDSRQIEVRGGTARLPDGTLSGTTHPLLAGVKNLVDWGLCDLGSAIALATAAPRQALGLPGLRPGMAATLLRWRPDGTWQRLALLD